jgi:methionyl-tRNA formyltransferase
MGENKNKLRIVFLGTPEFAATCLETILDGRHEVVGVVTAPDRESGRGRKITHSAVKTIAIERGVPIAQPQRLRDTDFLSTLKAWNADLGVVVAFRMLPEVVWAMPKLGTINLHASLLPQFRGAAPIQRAIMAGATETGATTFLLANKIDTGDVLDQIILQIGPSEDAGSLHDRILAAGKELLASSIDKLSNGDSTPIPQGRLSIEEGLLQEAPKLFKEDRLIDWTLDAETVYNQIRGLSPYPCAFTNVIGTINSPMKIIAGCIDTDSKLKPGQINITDSKMYVGTGTFNIEIQKIQPAGKGKMDASSFLRGLNNDLPGFI